MKFCPRCEIAYDDRNPNCPLCAEREKTYKLEVNIQNIKEPANLIHNKKVISLEEASALLKREIQTLYQWNHRKTYPDFPFEKEGSRLLVNFPKLKQWATIKGFKLHFENLISVTQS